ncbi:MAG TPA: hypothetical protein VIX20_15835 [Ktedonobacteraceae bacterium]
MTDYAAAIPMYVPSDNVFIDQIIPKWLQHIMWLARMGPWCNA